MVLESPARGTGSLLWMDVLGIMYQSCQGSWQIIRDVSNFFLGFTCVFFPGSTVQALNTTFGDQDAGILGFLPNISIVIFDAFQVYLQLQLTNFKITEVTLNSKPNLHWLFVSIY